FSRDWSSDVCSSDLGAWSNHILACAAAGAKFGFRTTAFVRGEPVDNPVLMMARLFGMDLRFVDRDQYRRKERLFEEHFSHQEARSEERRVGTECSAR